MGLLKNIDRVLSQDVGKFNIVTAGVDAITISLDDKNFFKNKIPALTYFSRPLDFIIQLVATPVFALYQTGKGIKDDFSSSIPKGIFFTVISPFTFGWKILTNFYSTSFITTPLQIAVPQETISDCKHPAQNAIDRAEKMHASYRFMFKDYIESQPFQNYIQERNEYRAEALERNDQEEQEREAEEARENPIFGEQYRTLEALQQSMAAGKQKAADADAQRQRAEREVLDSLKEVETDVHNLAKELKRKNAEDCDLLKAEINELGRQCSDLGQAFDRCDINDPSTIARLDKERHQLIEKFTKFYDKLLPKAVRDSEEERVILGQKAEIIELLLKLTVKKAEDPLASVIDQTDRIHDLESRIATVTHSTIVLNGQYHDLKKEFAGCSPDDRPKIDALNSKRAAILAEIKGINTEGFPQGFKYQIANSLNVLIQDLNALSAPSEDAKSKATNDNVEGLRYIVSCKVKIKKMLNQCAPGDSETMNKIRMERDKLIEFVKQHYEVQMQRNPSVVALRDRYIAELEGLIPA